MIREAPAHELAALIPILRAAEHSERAQRWSLSHLSDAVYRMDDEHDGSVVGVATMRWRDDPCELVELAIAARRRGAGLGRALVAWLVDEARPCARARVGHRATKRAAPARLTRRSPGLTHAPESLQIRPPPVSP